MLAGLAPEHLVYQPRGASAAYPIAVRKTDRGYMTNHIVSVGDFYWAEVGRKEVTRVHHIADGVECFK